MKHGHEERWMMRVWSILAVASFIFGWPGYSRSEAWHGQSPELRALRKPILWRDPGAVEKLNLAGGPGGLSSAPAPPFAFQTELTGGTHPKVKVKDGRGRIWAVKWGQEVRPEIVSSRLAWACGYFVPEDYLVRRGTITRVPATLRRAAGVLDASGRFAGALFQHWDPGYRHDQSWSWDDNPFVGTKELQGLKILVMLTSNWDNKDVRDKREGSNTAVSERTVGKHPVAVYMVSDWGSSLGHWGAPFLYRDSWNCVPYTLQADRFVTGVRDGMVEWGFQGTRNIGSGIVLADVAWLLKYLGRISDRQLVQALTAAGATPDERECFRSAIRTRIRRLKEIVKRP
jgi:hypothetical protein